jgi:hypothetical protein
MNSLARGFLLLPYLDEVLYLFLAPFDLGLIGVAHGLPHGCEDAYLLLEVCDPLVDAAERLNVEAG